MSAVLRAPTQIHGTLSKQPIELAPARIADADVGATVVHQVVQEEKAPLPQPLRRQPPMRPLRLPALSRRVVSLCHPASNGRRAAL